MLLCKTSGGCAVLTKKAIKSRGYTIKAFARALRISRSHIYDIINGICRPSEDLAKRIARVLGYNVEKLLLLYNEIKPKFDPKLIRKLMIQSGCNQKQFAEKIGIAASTLSNILALRRGIGEKTLSGLKRLYPALFMKCHTLNERG